MQSFRALEDVVKDSVMFVVVISIKGKLYMY